MDYEGKFRDFIIGWIAGRIGQAEISYGNAETVSGPDLHARMEALYDAIIYTASDLDALATARRKLGDETVNKVWSLSRQWQDPIVTQALPQMTALRTAIIAATGDASEFFQFFLNPYKTGCVPDGFEDRLEERIVWMFRVLYHTVGETVLAPKGWTPYVVVEPSYEADTNIVLLAHPQNDHQDKVFILQDWRKAWHISYPTPTALAEELLALRRKIEAGMLKSPCISGPSTRL